MSDTMQDIADALQADFDLRAVGAHVDFGNWNAEVHAAADHVVIGLGAFDPDATGFPAGMSPGPVIFGISPEAAASTVAVQGQEGIAWVHGLAPEGTAEALIPRASHARTQRLLHATIAALRRIVGRGALIFAAGEWPAVAQGDVTYGALARFRFKIAIPVLGDAYAVVPKPYSVQTTVKASLPSGEVIVSQGTPEPVP